MITLIDYYMGRDKTHASELTPEITANAEDLLVRINRFLFIAEQAGVHASIDPETKTIICSGWRPAGINAATANSAKNSTHMVGNGCDIRDLGKRPLATWACSADGRKALEECGLWCERPQWTPTWLHLQRIKPKSGNRFYIPSSAPAKAAPLPNEGP